MNPAQLKSLAGTDVKAETSSDAEAPTGQKVATETPDLPITDGSAAMLGMVAPTPAQLTALVLSPNMTAITPSQPSPDAGSLVAFAKSQGLDEDVAAWLMAAGQGKGNSPAGTSSKTDGTPQASDVDASALANAAVAISLLGSPGQAVNKIAVTDTATTDTSPTPVQLMPMAMPAAWLTPRTAASAKTGPAGTALPLASNDKASVHSSDLDLSQIFAPTKPQTPASASVQAPFVPAAWVMAGATSDTAQAASLVKTLADDTRIEDSANQVDGLNSVSTERGASKLSDPLGGATSSNAKAAESGLTTAQRSELHQAQAEKMGQAIGQRMLSEMEKGHWHLKMMLKPANLGNIEVEMRLRNGELDANFTASQAATRDLLQDGLPKLKDTLTQMGMDVANMNIGGGSGQKNGGDSTPQQTPTLTPAAKMASKEDTTEIQSAQITSSSQDGLDVLV